MLTLKVITENPEDVIRRLAKKHFDGKEIIGKIIELDKTRRTSQQELDKNLSELNLISKTIGQLMKEGKKNEAEAARNKVSELKESNKSFEEAKTKAETDMHNLLVLIPNLPHESVLEDHLADANVVVQQSG